MAFTEEVQKAFQASLADAEGRKQGMADSRTESAKRVATRFKVVADTIRAIKVEVEQSYPKIRIALGETSAYISGNGDELSFTCYEILETPDKYSGQYQYQIYLDLSEDNYFSHYFDENQVESFVYLVQKTIADYCVFGTIPQDTFYYQMSQLGQTSRDSDLTIARMQNRIIELMTEEEKQIFAKYLEEFYYPDGEKETFEW